MAFTQEEKIIIIARLQVYLSKFHGQPDLHELCNRIDNAIVSLMKDAATTLEQKSIRDLLVDFKSFAPKEPVLLFNDLFAEQRLKSIELLRQKAISTNTYLNLSSYHTGYDQIPIQPYSWDSTMKQFHRIVDEFGTDQMNFERLVYYSKELFNISSKGSKPVSFPDLTDQIIKALINQGHVSSMDASDLIDDINFIKYKTKNQGTENLEALFAGDVPIQDFLDMGHDAYRFLQEYWASNHLQKTIDIKQYLILWNGPGKAEFLQKFAASFPNKKNFELCFACIGVHPEKSKSKWLSETELRKKEDLSGLKELLKTFNDNKFVYSFSYVASFEGDPDRPLSKQWQTIFEKLHQKKEESEIVDCAPSKAPESISQEPRLHQENINKTATVNTVTHKADRSDIELDLDFEELSAPDKKLSTEDQIVQEQSTWSKYLKPFLSENLLGVLGAALLMLAWLCISIWVWDKGDYYKLLTGALPMYCTTLALAYISKFFHKNLDKGVSPRAPALFAFICVLSIPFNYLIALSMFHLQSAIGPVAGIGLGVLYTITLILFIGKWIKDSIGFNPGIYLSTINAFLFLPAISLVAGEQILPLAINIILFATFFLCANQIHKTFQLNSSKHKFRYLLFGINYLLTLFISCVYVRIIPDAMSVAILLEFIAISIVLLGKQEKVTRQIIVAISLSVLGILISLKSVYPASPFCILLSAWLWKLNKKHIQTTWIDEVLAGHIFLLTAGIIYELNQILTPPGSVIISWSIIGFTMSLAFTILYEKKLPKVTIHSVSYLIPIVLLALPCLNYLGMLQGLPGFAISLCAVLMIGSYGYYRYALHYNRILWFINIVIMSCMPCCLLLILQKFDLALLSFAFTALIWTIISHKFNDALSHTHRTAVSMFLSTLAVAGFILSCLLFHFVPYNLSLIQAIAFACMFTSTSIVAKNTMSQLPIYFLFLTSMVFGIIIHQIIDINMKSGVGTAATGIGFLYISYLFRVNKTWEKESPDTIFNHHLPLSSKAFLTFPFELAGWVLALTAFVKICQNYTLLYSGGNYFSFFSIKIFIALLITAYIFYLFVKKYNINHSGFLIFLPATLILLSISSTIPIIILPVWTILFLFAYDYFTIYFSAKGKLEPCLRDPIMQVNTFLNYAGVLISFILYIYYVDLLPESIWNRYLLFICVALILIYLHKIFVAKGKLNFAHLVPLHTLILLTLGYILLKQPDYLMDINSVLDFFDLMSLDFLILITIGSIILFFPEVIFENSKNKILKNYSNVFGIWLFGISCLFSIFIFCIFILSIVEPYSSPLIKLLPFFTIFGYFLIHAGNRLYKNPLLYGVKAFLCCYSGALLFATPFSGVIFGFIAFAAIESLLYYCFKNRMPSLMECPAKSSDSNINYPVRFAHASHIFFYFALLLHVAAILSAMPDYNQTPHYMLYLIIPFLVFCFRILNRIHFGYLALGLFAYINAFISLNFYEIFIQNNLNMGHLLSISILFTILIFLLYNLGKSKFTKEVAI